MLVARRARRRGLGQEVPPDMLEALTTPSGPVGAQSVPWYCSYLLYPPFEWFGSYAECVTPSIQSGPSAVAENAATYYGAESETAQVAAQAAAEQNAAVPANAANIENYYAFNPLGSNNYDNPSGAVPVWAWVALALGGGLIVVSALK